jgi:four helix bundle protein
MATHHDLKVWQRAQDFAAAVHAMTNGPPVQTAPSVIWQLRRSAQSIAANIAEGRGLGTNPQFRRHLLIALGSASETDSHLEYALTIGLLPSGAVGRLRDEVATIRRMLLALHKSLHVH